MLTHTLPPIFYNQSTVTVAHELIGKMLIRIIGSHRIVGIIAETEAYPSNDPASHAYKGKTQRNSPLFGPVGHTYVYFSYGLHYCLNIVSHDSHVEAGGVLIRAFVPLRPLCCQRSHLLERPVHKKNKNIVSGPGNVTKALSITGTFNNIDVTSHESKLIVAQGITVDDSCIETTPRIGISKAKEKLWRFVLNPDSCGNVAIHAQLTQQLQHLLKNGCTCKQT